MTARSIFAWVGLALALAAAAGAAGPRRTSRPADPFGGVGPHAASPTGFFRLVDRDARWLLLTPLGDPFWMRAVYGVDLNDGGVKAQQALRVRFHGNPMAFAENADRRLHAWGFNVLGGYASAYALPLATYFRPAGNPVKLPFLRELNIACYGVFDTGGLAPAPFKTLLAGAVDPAVYRGWPGLVPDVFDPNFAIYARRLAADTATPQRQTIFTSDTAAGGAPQPSLANSPWLLATLPDDSDCLFGFGSAAGAASDALVPNIGWIVAVTPPTQAENSQVGLTLGERRTVRYADRTVYAKLAWADYLRRQYRTIAALNRAWGSDYTTFDSDGGWPYGRGVLDESGRHRWIGDDPVALATASPAVRRDLDAFLGLYADRYFAVVTAAIRAATPRQLIFSSVLDAWGGLTRPQILQAAGRYCDALQVGIAPGQPAVLDATYRAAGKPVFVWLGLRADGDSAVGDSAVDGSGGAQAERGAAYARDLDWLYRFRVAGVAPVIGIAWWEYMDKVGEKANWGLVTPGDNAYDGREDVPGRGRDAWGEFGGEAAAYGDFLGAVSAANRRIDAALAGTP